MKPIADQTTAVAETVQAKPQSLARRGFLASAAAGVAAATVANVIAHADLFRAGIAAFALEQIAFLLLRCCCIACSPRRIARRPR